MSGRGHSSKYCSVSRCTDGGRSCSTTAGWRTLSTGRYTCTRFSSATSSDDGPPSATRWPDSSLPVGANLPAKDEGSWPADDQVLRKPGVRRTRERRSPNKNRRMHKVQDGTKYYGIWEPLPNFILAPFHEASTFFRFMVLRMRALSCLRDCSYTPISCRRAVGIFWLCLAYWRYLYGQLHHQGAEFFGTHREDVDETATPTGTIGATAR